MFSTYLELKLKTSVDVDPIEVRCVDNFLSEALSRARITLPALTPSKVVRLGSIGLNKFKVLLITSSKYDDGSGKLGYRIGTHPSTYYLTGPHLFRGKGQAQLFPSNPYRLVFQNLSSNKVELDILALHDPEDWVEPPTPVNVRLYPDDIHVLVNDQTIFPLSHIPQFPEDVMCSVNGFSQVYGDLYDYTVLGQQLIWNNKDFHMTIGDTVQVKYLYALA